uniref:Secreted protein n=1 Tax=Leersia perrieri TaxID=77586 RepID=A0A0D9VX26_9ORYZ
MSATARRTPRRRTMSLLASLLWHSWDTYTMARSAASSSSSPAAAWWAAALRREAEARSRSFSSLRARHSPMTLRSATLGVTSVVRSSRWVSGQVGRRPLSRHSRNHLRIASRSNVCPVSIVTGSLITCFVSGHTNASNAPSSSDQTSIPSPAMESIDRIAQGWPHRSLVCSRESVVAGVA